MANIINLQAIEKLMASEVAKGLQGKDFLKLLDFSTDEILYFVDLAEKLKACKKQGIAHKLLTGKNIALIFEKTSTRTRCAFEVAGYDLGMNVTYLDSQGSQIGKKESISDTAQVLAGMFDGIEYRGYGQVLVEELAKYSKVPVWNGLTDEFHPTQILADFLTIKEKFGKLKGLKLVYMGDSRFNMGNSLMVGCAKVGINFVACCPKQYFPKKELIDTCKKIAAQNDCTLEFEEDVQKAVKGANVVYTDVWVSMGEPFEVWQTRINELKPYKVTMNVMNMAADNAVFMHCLPAYHDKNTKIGKEICDKFDMDSIEVTDEVFSSDKSVVFDEAENRMHTIKAVMLATLAK